MWIGASEAMICVASGITLLRSSLAFHARCSLQLLARRKAAPEMPVEHMTMRFRRMVIIHEHQTHTGNSHPEPIRSNSVQLRLAISQDLAKRPSHPSSQRVRWIHRITWPSLTLIILALPPLFLKPSSHLLPSRFPASALQIQVQ